MERSSRVAPVVVRICRFLVAWGTPIGLGVLLAHAACSPSHTDVSGLIAPPKVSVVTVDPAAITSLVHAQAPPPAFPSGSEYFTDPIREYVFDGSLHVLDTLNEVLCLVAQSRYDALLNRGVYRAQIDESLCGAKQTDVNQPGQGRQLEDWIVHSFRRDPGEPHRVQFWVPGMQGPGGSAAPPVTLFSELDIYAPPTDMNPYGVFRMNFAGVPDGGSVHAPSFCGLIHAKSPGSGHIGFELFFLVGDPANVPPVGEEFERTQVNVDLAADQMSGVAHVSKAYRRNDTQTGDSGLLNEDFRLAFDAGTVVRSEDGGAASALDRTTFDVCNLRYNLYDNGTQLGGARVKTLAGAPILLPTGEHGYVDSRGLYLPPGTTAADGDKVFLEHDGVVDANPLTLRIAPGRLIENLRNSTPLAQVVNEVFEWDMPFDPSFPGAFRYHLLYDGVDFVAIEQFDFTNGVWLAINPFVIQLDAYGVLRLRSSRFGGNVSYTLNATDIVWFTERTVSGDANPPTKLYGFLACLRPALGALEVESGDVYFPDQLNLQTPYAFQFNPSDRTLYYDDLLGNLYPVGLKAGQVPQTGPFLDGMRSGPLVTDPTQLQSVYDLWNAPLFYTWETGANSWNQWSGLEDPQKRNVLAFDPPIQFTYVHSAANDQNGDPSQDGKQFLLEYRGDGQLYGIPFVQVDTDGDGKPDHSVPQINLADGTVLGPNGSDFVVRATERELVLKPAAIVPPGLDPALADSLALPDGSAYTTPDIGDVPVVSTPPAVVGGEIQLAHRR